MKLPSILFLLIILSSCSGGGGSGGESRGTEQLPVIAYIYPDNTLEPGQGIVEVSPIDVKCFLPNGEEATTLEECPALADVDLSTAPKEIQRSPAGNALVVIDNSDEGGITISFGEGESWSSYENSVKVEKTESLVNCQSGFAFSYQATCEIPSPDFLYGEWSTNIPEICSGQGVQTRAYTCVSNITGGEVDSSECSALTPNDSRVVLSPEGIKEDVTLPNGDIVNLLCEEGADESDLGTNTTIFQVVFCGPDRDLQPNGLCDYSLVCTGDTYRVENTCVPDVFTVAELLYEAPPVGAGMNISVAPTGVKTCTRDREGVVEEVDSSKCTMPTDAPEILMNSPAGTYLHTTAQGDIYAYELTEGQVFYDYLPKSEVISCGPDREEIPLEKFCANKNGVTGIHPIDRGFLITWDDDTSKILTDKSIPAELSGLVASKEITGVHIPLTTGRVAGSDVYTVKSGGLYLDGSSKGYHADAVDFVIGSAFVIKIKADGSGEFIQNFPSYDDFTTGIDFGEVRQVNCMNSMYGWDELKGCAILMNNGNLTVTNPDMLNTYEVDTNESSPVVNIVSRASEFTTDIKKFHLISHSEGHTFIILKEDNTLHFVGMKFTSDGNYYLANLPYLSNVVDFQSGYSDMIVEREGDVIERYTFDTTSLGVDLLYDGSVAINRDHPDHLHNQGIYLVDGTVRSLVCSSMNESLGEVLWFTALSGSMCSNEMSFISADDNMYYRLNGSTVSGTGWKMNTIIPNRDYLASRMGANWAFYYRGGQRSAWNMTKP